MVQIGNEEEGKFTSDRRQREIEEKFAPKILLTIRDDNKCTFWFPKLLCVFLILFSSYEICTLFIPDAHGPVPPSSLIKAVYETRATLEAISQANALASITNKETANEYLDEVQNVLKKRVERRVKQISVLVVEKVQEMENQLSVFDRSISTTVDGNLDFTKDLLAGIKSTVEAVTNTNATSTLEDAIKRIEDEVTKFTTDLDQMYSFYGRHINDILYHKTENITARIRMILVKDRKLCRNLAPQRVALCYKISKQNYEVSGRLEKVLDATTKLQSVNDVVNAFSASLDVGHSTNTTKALETALDATKLASDIIMNTDDNFLGTVLKKLAYNKHLEMRDFIYQGYETAIRSLVPALQKVSRDFSVVKDRHRKRIAAVLNPEIADAGKLIFSKSSLITDDIRRNNVIQNGEFKSMYTMLENKFKNASSTVNQLFVTKQGQMIEGLTLSLDFTLTEQLPSVATWSLLDYLPVETCPLSIDFQTYLKSTMDRRLQKNSQAVSATLQQVDEVDAEFDPAKRGAKKMLESDSVSSTRRGRDVNRGDEVKKIHSFEDNQSASLSA